MAGTTHSANTAGNAEKPRQLPGVISKRLFVRSEAGAIWNPEASEGQHAIKKGCWTVLQLGTRRIVFPAPAVLRWNRFSLIPLSKDSNR
jgi:hypothetical protein